MLSLAELKLSPSQQKTIELQARPLEKSTITGTLNVSLLLMEHSKNDSGKHHSYNHEPFQPRQESNNYGKS